MRARACLWAAESSPIAGDRRWARAPEETLDQKALVTLFTKALLALGDLAVHVEGLTLGDEDYDWIYARELVDKLGASFDRTVAALNPIEQVERRGEIIA